jgi:PPM family protein phosphatase
VPEIAPRSVTADTRRGFDRPANEDRWMALSDGGAVLLAVADGMGGTAGGGAAATRALVSVLDALRDGLAPNTVAAALANAVTRAQQRVRAAAGGDAMAPGTTLTVAVAIAGRLHLAHIGDSSCWLYRRGRLRRLTEVHTSGAVLVAAGAVSGSSPAARRLDSLLTRYVGMPGRLEPQLGVVRLRAEDRVLVASDGLTRAVPVPALGALLADRRTTADRLVTAAVAAGGRDDVTAVLATVDADPQSVHTGYAATRG